MLDTDRISAWTSRSRWRSVSGYSLSATAPRSTTTSAARSGPELATKRFANRPNPGPLPGWACTWYPTCPTPPPFIDRILPDAPAARAGLQPDDLILYLNHRAIPSCRALREELALIDHIDPLHLTIQRGNQLLDLQLHND